MFIYILAFLDLWTGVILIPMELGWLPVSIILIHSLYLFLKGLFYWGDLYSVLDVIVAFYILLMILGVSHMFFTILASIYLLQKAIMSFKL